MANEIRVRSNFKSGIIDDNPLSNSATTLNSSNLAGLPAIGATEHCALVLDPTGVGNGPEVVWVTAHTGSATSATIVRGREGTSGVQHASTIAWVHVPTASDFTTTGTTASRPSGTGLPFQHQRYFDTTLGYEMIYNGSAWVAVGPQAATVATSEARTLSSYGALSTSGPAVTIETGTEVIVRLTCYGNPAVSGGVAGMSFTVSGATTLAADDARALIIATPSGNGWGERKTAEIHLSALTAGSNVFTAVYKSDGSNSQFFANRTISVTPIF